MKLQKIVNRLQKLHPKEIDLSLDRIKKLCEKLGIFNYDIQCIQVCGTNGKGSTISFLHSILKEAKLSVMFILHLTLNQLMKDLFIMMKLSVMKRL